MHMQNPSWMQRCIFLIEKKLHVHREKKSIGNTMEAFCERNEDVLVGTSVFSSIDFFFLSSFFNNLELIDVYYYYSFFFVVA